MLVLAWSSLVLQQQVVAWQVVSLRITICALANSGLAVSI